VLTDSASLVCYARQSTTLQSFPISWIVEERSDGGRFTGLFVVPSGVLTPPSAPHGIRPLGLLPSPHDNPPGALFSGALLFPPPIRLSILTCSVQDGSPGSASEIEPVSLPWLCFAFCAVLTLGFPHPC